MAAAKLLFLLFSKRDLVIDRPSVVLGGPAFGQTGAIVVWGSSLPLGVDLGRTSTFVHEYEIVAASASQVPCGHT